MHERSQSTIYENINGGYEIKCQRNCKNIHFGPTEFRFDHENQPRTFPFSFVSD